jgi:hypothetical protein
MSLLSGFRSMISDGIDGSVSSKRVVTLIALSLVVLAFILNLFWDFTVEEYMSLVDSERQLPRNLVKNRSL